MSSENNRVQLILEHEQGFADHLALKVFEQPKMGLWMILIPIIFVFYLNDLKKCKEGRQAFVANYLLSRKCAIAEAAEVEKSGRKPDLRSLAAKAGLPPDARQRFTEMLAILVEHYIVLLRSEGNNYQALLLNAYRSHDNYSAFINRLNEAEKALNLALTPQLTESVKEVGDVVRSIEMYSGKIRRAAGEKYFDLMLKEKAMNP
jgi:hypothetical protein